MLQTFGQHLRRKRLDLNLSVIQAAKDIGITDSTLILWEYDRRLPSISFYPLAIAFIGYDPLYDNSGTLSAKIENYRRKHGLSYDDLGELIGIQGAGLGKIAQGKGNPKQVTIDKILKIVEPSN
ncbi:MAG: helix-turn-helix domain-containing protein [Saprospiraceae bacterium]